MKASLVRAVLGGLSLGLAALACGYAGFIVSKMFQPYRDSTNMTYAVVAGLALLSAAGFAACAWLVIEREHRHDRALLAGIGCLSAACGGAGIVAGLS